MEQRVVPKSFNCVEQVVGMPGATVSRQRHASPVLNTNPCRHKLAAAKHVGVGEWSC